MSSTYSTNLAIELIGTGDQAGAWGNTTNTNLGTLIEQAISGYVTQAVSTGATTTITIPNGATGVARNMYIELTGTGGASTFLEVPSNKKLYFIYNNTTGAVTVRVSGQTGVSVLAGEKKILVSNGTDIVEATTYIINGNSANLTTLTVASANITTLTGTTFGDTGITQLRGASGNITTLTGSVFGTVATTQLRGASGVITTLAGTTATYSDVRATSANITTLTGTTFGDTSTTQLRGASGVITTLTGTTSTYSDVRGTSGNITTLTGTTVTYASGNIGQFGATSANITTLTGTTATYSDVRGTSANITTLTGTNFSATSLTLTNALGRASGGTGVATAPSNGQLLIGNGTGYTLAALTAGSNISITNGAGSISIAATGGLTGTTSANLTALGVGAAASLTSGSSNTCVGYNAGNSINTGSFNTLVGHAAGDSITDSNWNSMVGYFAGNNVTTGTANSFVGYYAGNGVSTGGLNSALGDSSFYSGNYTNSTCLGYDSGVNGSNQVQLGNSSTTAYAYGAVVDRASDIRDKADVQDTNLGLNFVMSLRPRMYRWDYREDYRPPKPSSNASKEEWDAWREACKIDNLTHNGTHKRTRFHQGLIAQEVKQVMDTMGIDFGGYQDFKIKGGEDRVTIAYGELIGPIIKALQELKAEFDEYKRTHP